MSIEQECGNLKLVDEDGELTRNNNRKIKSYKPIDVHYEANATDEFEISKVFLAVNFVRVVSK